MGYWKLQISQHTGYFIYWRKCITGWMIIIIISWSRLSNMLYKRVAEEPGCQRAGLLPERYPFFPLWLSLQHFFVVVTIRLLSRGWCVMSSRVRTVWSPLFNFRLSLRDLRGGVSLRRTRSRGLCDFHTELRVKVEERRVFFSYLVWSFASQLGAFFFYFFFFLKMSKQVSSLIPGRVARVLTDTPVGIKPATF